MNRTEMIDELSVWAERYAINRKSYSNGRTARVLQEAATAGYLTDNTTKVIVEDIDEAIAHGIIPYEDQVREWKQLRDILNFQINPGRYM